MALASDNAANAGDGRFGRFGRWRRLGRLAGWRILAVRLRMTDVGGRENGKWDR